MRHLCVWSTGATTKTSSSPFGTEGTGLSQAGVSLSSDLDLWCLLSSGLLGGLLSLGCLLWCFLGCLSDLLWCLLGCLLDSLLDSFLCNFCYIREKVRSNLLLGVKSSWLWSQTQSRNNLSAGKLTSRNETAMTFNYQNALTELLMIVKNA